MNITYIELPVISRTWNDDQRKEAKDLAIVIFVLAVVSFAVLTLFVANERTADSIRNSALVVAFGVVFSGVMATLSLGDAATTDDIELARDMLDNAYRISIPHDVVREVVEHEGRLVQFTIADDGGIQTYTASADGNRFRLFDDKGDLIRPTVLA